MYSDASEVIFDDLLDIDQIYIPILAHTNIGLAYTGVSQSQIRKVKQGKTRKLKNEKPPCSLIQFACL